MLSIQEQTRNEWFDSFFLSFVEKQLIEPMKTEQEMCFRRIWWMLKNHDYFDLWGEEELF